MIAKIQRPLCQKPFALSLGLLDASDSKNMPLTDKKSVNEAKSVPLTDFLSVSDQKCANDRQKVCQPKTFGPVTDFLSVSGTFLESLTDKKSVSNRKMMALTDKKSVSDTFSKLHHSKEASYKR